MPQSKLPTHRFETLDALRGIAALLVVQVHLPYLFAAQMPFPHAYLAVDFFFMLSGFVLSFAYGQRLDGGWPTAAFLRERFIRLYPLYLLSLPLGIAGLVIFARQGRVPLNRGSAALLFSLALVLLPLPARVAAGGVFAFPCNLASWSLFYEVLANIVHALGLRRRSLATLSAISAAAALLLFGLSRHTNGINLGGQKGTVPGGLARVLFSYVLGMVLFRLWHGGRLRRFGSIWIPVVLLAGVLVSPESARHNSLLDLLLIALVFPAAVLIGANAKPPKRLLPLFSFLGTTSYAVYVFHVPLYAVYRAAWGILLHSRPGDHAPGSGLLYLAVLLLAAAALDAFYDLPVRAWLKQRLRK